MPQPAHGLNVLLTSTARYPFVQDDIDLLGRHFRLDVYIGHGVRGAWEHARRAMRADVSISWFGSVYTFFLVLGARLGRRRSIVILGGADTANRPDLDYGIWRSRWKGLLLGHALRRADRILAVDMSLRAVLEESTGRRWEMIQAVPTGYDAALWEPGPTKEPVVLSVARCDTPAKAVVKGIDRMIAAARAMPEVSFRIIGLENEAMRAYAGTVPANVVLSGPLPRLDLLGEYQRAAVYCQLSRSEGLPNALCEAMLCGCVPVGSRVGGIPTAIADCGFLVNDADDPVELRAALESALAATETLGPRARARIAEGFSRERRERALVDIIMELARA